MGEAPEEKHNQETCNCCYRRKQDRSNYRWWITGLSIAIVALVVDRYFRGYGWVVVQIAIAAPLVVVFGAFLVEVVFKRD